jgi:phytoene dehydrogenase-like protein
MTANFRRQAVVVGAGPNGLAAAITLAQAGLRVTILEASETIGGGLRSAALTLPGFTHDVCSAIHPLAVSSPFFRSLPLGEAGLEWIHPEIELAHPLGPDAAVCLHRSVDETAASLGRDGSAYRRWMLPMTRHADAVFSEALQPMLHLPKHPVTLARFGLRSIWPASGFARALFAGGPARALLAGLAAHSFLPLSKLGSAAFATVLGLAGHASGWPMPRGGSQRIADALAKHFLSLGGEIETGRRIESLSDLPEARVVLFDVTTAQFARIAAERLPPSYLRRLKAFRQGPGVFKVDYALSAPIPWAAEPCRRAGTIHVGGTLEEIAQSEYEVSQGRHPERPFVLVAQQSLFDPTRAPAGKHTLWAYCHVPNRSTVNMSERIEQQIERFAPGFRDCILARHQMDTAAMEQRNSNLVGGDINGGAADLPQLLARPILSPEPYRTPLPGYYLCSSSTPPGGGVHGMCGWHAARVALRDLQKS